MSHFGGYIGGDPRKFFPDPEMSSPEEMQAHKEACKAWDRGERPEPATVINGPGFHASVRPFGIGVTMEPEQEVDDEREPDLPLEKLEDEELYGIYLSNAGQQSEDAMRILASRHHAELAYEDPHE